MSVRARRLSDPTGEEWRLLNERLESARLDAEDCRQKMESHRCPAPIFVQDREHLATVAQLEHDLEVERKMTADLRAIVAQQSLDLTAARAKMAAVPTDEDLIVQRDKAAKFAMRCEQRMAEVNDEHVAFLAAAAEIKKQLRAALSAIDGVLTPSNYHYGRYQS